MKIPVFVQNKTIILVDPVSTILQEIQSMRVTYDEFNVTDIIRNYLTIGNTHINRKGPTGVLIPSVRWKHTQ